MASLSLGQDLPQGPRGEQRVDGTLGLLAHARGWYDDYGGWRRAAALWHVDILSGAMHIVKDLPK